MTRATSVSGPIATDDISAEVLREAIALSTLLRDEVLPVEIRALRAAREPALYGPDLAWITAADLAQVAPAIAAETGVDLLALQREYGGPMPEDPRSSQVPRAASAGPKSPRRKGIRSPTNLPYPYIARLIGQGLRPDAIARMLGFDAERIERNLRRSPRFRRWIEAEKQAIAASAEAAANLARARAAGRLKDAVATGSVTEQPTIARRILELGLGSGS